MELYEDCRTLLCHTATDNFCVVPCYVIVIKLWLWNIITLFAMPPLSPCAIIVFMGTARFVSFS